MPGRWSETVEKHRHDVRDAILDNTAALVAQRGLLSVTMSEIAAKTGIGRATLYRYFPEVEAILFAWHDRQIQSHLQLLIEARDRTADPTEQLKAVLQAYALRVHELRGPHDTELAAILHRGQHVARAEQQLNDLVRDLLEAAAEAGGIRDDAGADDLASYCVHALSAARTMPSRAAVGRLVDVTLTGLRAR